MRSGNTTWGRRVREPELRGEFSDIKRAENELMYTADDFKKASERLGSKAEIEEVDNEVVSLQTRLEAFKQACRIELQSDARSFVSRQRSFSQKSNPTTTSSIRIRLALALAKAELKRRRAQETNLKEADELEEQTTRLEAENKKNQATERNAETIFIEAELDMK